MLPQAVCTVFNRRTDPQTRLEYWVGCALSGIRWQGGGAVSDRKSPRNGNVEIFIPFSAGCAKPYLSPRAFEAGGEGWTLREGDLLVQGDAGNGVSPLTAAEILAQQDDAVIIISVSANDYGSRRMRHWEVCGR